MQTAFEIIKKWSIARYSVNITGQRHHGFDLVRNVRSSIKLINLPPRKVKKRVSWADEIENKKTEKKKRPGRPRKHPIKIADPLVKKRPVGRPRKNPSHDVSNVSNDNPNQKLFKRRLTRSSNSSENSDMGTEEVTFCEGVHEERHNLLENTSVTNFYQHRPRTLKVKHSTLNMTDQSDLVHIPKNELSEENVWIITVQLFIPFLLAGFGMVAASLLLDLVQHWPVYQDIPEVYILVPALLGLKGNLEMTLASRLSTQANLGLMDTAKQQFSMIAGNLSLIQCQAIVVGFLASLAAVAMGWVPEGHFNYNHAFLLCASSILTASSASFMLGLVMVAVIVLSRRLNINPDNVATPIAASLGDLTTLALLSWLSSFLYRSIDSSPYISIIIILCGVLLVPLWAIAASRNVYTREVLDSGWTPVISAMLISSIGGLILDFTVSNYKGIAVFQLIINGVGGNLVAVQASRISTALHMEQRMGTLPPDQNTLCLNPFTLFCSKGGHARTARVLLAMVVPGHLIFSYTISYLKAGHTSFTPTFIITYLTAAVVQVLLLLYIGQIMINWMWKHRIDPDNSAIPYLTAIGDLLGTALLGIAFQFLYVIGDKDSDVGD